MAINVTAANQQAAEIAGKIGQLRSARNSLAQYRSQLQTNWQGQEVGLFVESVDREIRKIDTLIGSLNGLSNDIRRAAEEIRREEEAAARAAAARAEQQRRAAQARSAYNAACSRLDEVARERDVIIQKMRNTKSKKTMADLNAQLAELDKRIMEAQEACNRCRMALG